jgi:hypothetical protein
MKTSIKLLMWLILIVGSTSAWATDYLFEPEDYRISLGLVDYDTLLMSGGTIENLVVGGYAIATINNTDLPNGIAKLYTGAYGTVNIHGGGIGDIEAIDVSVINMTGGSVNYMEMHGPSTSYLSGGQINTMASDLIAFPAPPSGPPGLNGWIQFFCREYDYDDDTLILTGIWEDYSDFSMQLLNLGTIPTYDQIEFHIVPEPGTIILFGLGGIFLKRRVSKQ